MIVDSRDDKKQVECQINGHNSKVGFATNISSSLYCLLEEFPKGSKEHETILKRLKIGRVIQGEIIDGVKGLEIPPFRSHWTKYKEITKDMSDEEKEMWSFNNKILCQIRPSFFRFLYPHYMTRYNKELKKYNIYCHLNFQKSFGDICKSNQRTEKEQSVFESYLKHSYFLENNSVVNKISRYMRANIGLVTKYSYMSSQNFDYSVLKNPTYVSNPEHLSLMKSYLQEYKTFKKNMRNSTEDIYENVDTFISYIQKKSFSEISSNESELANYAIDVTYGDETYMVEFPWRVYSFGMLENISFNSSDTITFPVQDDNGEINYLYSKYTMKKYSLEELYGE